MQTNFVKHLVIHELPPKANLFQEVLKQAKPWAGKSTYLPQYSDENVALLTTKDAPRHAVVSGCLFLAGFQKTRRRANTFSKTFWKQFARKKTALAHIPSGEGVRNEASTRIKIADLVKHAGEHAEFFVFGMPLESAPQREELLEIISDHLKRCGAELPEENILRRGSANAAHGVFVNPKLQQVHLFYKPVEEEQKD